MGVAFEVLGWAGRIDVELERELSREPSIPPELRAPMAHVLLAPGKRIRPAFVMGVAAALGRPVERLMPAAIALEMFHAASLIQDDLPCMDDETERRGQKACHLRFGEARALLASDALVLRGIEVLLSYEQTRIGLGARCVGLALRALGASGLVLGQLRDLGGGEQLTIHQRIELAALKTAPLFRLAGELAAEVLGLPDEKARALCDWLDRVGVAFQLVDDALDGAGEPLRRAAAQLGIVESSPWPLLAQMAEHVLARGH